MNNLLEGRFHYFTQRELEMGRVIPDELYENIIPTAKILDALRCWYGKPIFVNSSYRSKEYNRGVGGAKKSLHIEFNALDFSIINKKHLPLLYDKLDRWDRSHYFTFLPEAGMMGIGLYSTFLHLDTRGVLGRISPKRW